MIDMHTIKIEDNQISIDGFKLKSVKEYGLKALPENFELTIKLQVKEINPKPEQPELAKGGIVESEQIILIGEPQEEKVTSIDEAKKNIAEFEKQIGILKHHVQMAEACQNVIEALKKFGKQSE